MFEVGLEMNMSLQLQEGGTGSPGRSKDTNLGMEGIWIPKRLVTG